MSGQSTLFKMDTFGTSTTDSVYPSYRDPNRVSYKEKQGPSQGVHLTEMFLIAIINYLKLHTLITVELSAMKIVIFPVVIN